MIIYVDIDETICTKTENLDYSKSIPIKENIEKINKLYESHYIKGNAENISMFSDLISDLELGMNKLGMFSIDKV